MWIREFVKKGGLIIVTQLIEAKKGNITEEMQIVFAKEDININDLMENIAKGFVVIPCNKKRNNLSPIGIGKGLTTKINANIGTSEDDNDIEMELKKAKTVEEAGADAIMDLSIGKKTLTCLRQKILAQTHLPVGTVPIYQAVVKADGCVKDMTADDIFRVIEEQAEDGVDFMTVHSGVTLSTIDRLSKQGRIADIVSRGGALLTKWMVLNQKENPLYANFDRVLEIAKKYDVTLSLGDGLRPGSVCDATDRAQIHELILLGELQKTAVDEGIQVMIEGPGHVPYNEIETNMKIQKKLCNNAPFYVLGPLVTDIAMGYDHIVSAIGGAAAASFGADFLCYVTPSEHLRLPTIDDVREGVIASKIAGHAGDIAKGIKSAIQKDKELSIQRKKRDWKKQFELCLDPEKARRMRQESVPETEDVCTMCGELCAMKVMDEIKESS